MQAKNSNQGDWRPRFRQTIPRWYNGRVHLMVVVGLTVAAVVACLSQLQATHLWHWLTVPMTLLYVNIFEYCGHRWPMHHPKPGLQRVYRRHTLEHHRFFNHQSMAVDHHRDYYVVLFAPVLVIFFSAVFVIPGWLLLSVMLGSNVAWLFAATILAYFLNYELLHLAYHQPWCERVPVLRQLARHHRRHHDPTQMSHCNFNVSYPLADWLFGTLKKP